MQQAPVAVQASADKPRRHARCRCRPQPGTCSPPPASAPKPDINGNHALQYVKEIVAFGSRPAGSSGHAKLEEYILSKLKGEEVEQDKFTAQTPVGKFPMNNIIAKFPGRKTASSLSPDITTRPIRCPRLCWRQRWRLVDGAVAGAGRPVPGQTARWLHRLAGLDRRGGGLREVDRHRQRVRHASSGQKWQQDGTAKKIKAFILVDMIGDADLDIQKETNSTPWLSDLVYQSASDMGYQSHFYQYLPEALMTTICRC